MKNMEQKQIDSGQQSEQQTTIEAFYQMSLIIMNLRKTIDTLKEDNKLKDLKIKELDGTIRCNEHEIEGLETIIETLMKSKGE